jgi:regulator of protease activity HflC (stomatin/prohibitin superfamily)
VIVFEYERGVLYRWGKFREILQPGSYLVLQRMETIQKIDVRTRFVTIPGQDVLSADNISIKVSMVASFKVEDPFAALNNTNNYIEALYLILQLELRDLCGSTPIDELLVKRGELGTRLSEKGKEKAAELGLTLLYAGIKDIMLPGDLKNIFAQIVNARNAGLAALEKARGESAALRNLANAAKSLENNPALLQLRILHALEGKSGNTIVLSTSPETVNGLLGTSKK